MKQGLASVLALVLLTTVSVALGGYPGTSLMQQYEEAGLLPRNQGSRGTCTLFAVEAAASFEVWRTRGGAAQQLSPEFLGWAASEGGGSSNRGWSVQEAFVGLQKHGICSESRMPYRLGGTENQTPDDAAIAEARGLAGCWELHWIMEYGDGPPNDADITEMKKVLDAGHPIIVGIAPPKYEYSAVQGEVNSGPVFNGPVLVREDRTEMNQLTYGSDYKKHSIIITGYCEEPHKSGIFEFRNSFGPDWHSCGYMDVPIDQSKKIIQQAVWLSFHPQPPRS